jgi:hypothetical protein
MKWDSNAVLSEYDELGCRSHRTKSFRRIYYPTTNAMTLETFGAIMEQAEHALADSIKRWLEMKIGGTKSEIA